MSVIVVNLVITVVVELLVLLLVRERRRKVLLLSAGMNCITNVPLNCFILLHGGVLLYTLLALEVLVVLVESAIFYIFAGNWKLSLLYSLACNASSFLVGILIQYF